MKANGADRDDGLVVGWIRVAVPRRFDLDEPVAFHADAHLAVAAAHAGTAGCPAARWR